MRRWHSTLPVLALGCVARSTPAPPTVHANAHAPARVRPPASPEPILARAEHLAKARDLAALLALHDEHRARLGDPDAAELDLLVAGLLAGLAREGDERASLERALELAAGVRARMPDHVRAYTLPARWLLRVNRAADARPLADRAAELAPTDRKTRRLLWDSILATPAATREDVRAELVPKLEALVASPADAWDLHDAAEMYGRLGLDTRRDELWARIDADYPDSEAADHVAWARIDVLRDRQSLRRQQQGKADPLLATELERRYRAILADPDHRPQSWRGRAWLGLFFVLHAREGSVDPEDLLHVVEGVLAHEKANFHLVYGLVPRVLAERTPHHERALEIAEQGFAALDEAVASHPANDPADKKQARTEYLVQLSLAKAAILVQAGRVDEAESVLEQAQAEAGRRADILAGFGEIDEKRGDLAAARAHYVEGIGLEVQQLNRPCSNAIHRLYVAQHHGERGFARYMKRIRAKHQEARKAEVLAELVTEDGELEPFRLASLRGETISSDDLEGKVAVVHFWATWCGFCVVEMKAIAELVKTYEKDRDVEIVLVSGDHEVAMLGPWMAEHGLAVDTLLDDGYATTAGIREWPATLFIDRAGKIRERHSGATSDLVEEFSWRIDALK
jgi:cytochrome c biogenesis protein CcmG, thiol:disulfide interchange protein DsbE